MSSHAVLGRQLRFVRRVERMSERVPHVTAHRKDTRCHVIDPSQLKPGPCVSVSNNGVAPGW